MTYQECKNQVLKLLNQYTIAGSSVATTYNNQDDYIKRIPSLINDAMMELSTTVRKIETVYALTAEVATDSTDREYRFVMPSDFYQFKSGDSFITWRDKGRHNQAYWYRGKNYVVLPKWIVDNCAPVVTYYRYPTLLPEEDASITPGTPLDNALEVHRAIPYYVAGMLAAHDDAFLASTLMNGYEDKLAKMEPQLTTDVAPVSDVYQFNRPWSDYYHY
jgi:hypothetical protein